MFRPTLRNSRYVYYGQIVVVTLVAYFWSLGYFFINDDFFWLETAVLAVGDPAHLLDLSQYHEFRPAVNLYFFVDHLVFGLDPLGFHLTNLGIHIINSIMVAYLAGSLASSEKVGGLTGILFSVNWAYSGTVEWVSAASALLGTFFLLLAMVSFRKYVLAGWSRHYLISLVAFIMALLSVEYTMTLPLLLAVYTWLSHQERATGGMRCGEGIRGMKVVLPFFVIALIFVLFQYGLQLGYNPANERTYYRHEGLVSMDDAFDNLIRGWQMLWMPFMNDLWKEKVVTSEMEVVLLSTLFIMIGSLYLLVKGGPYVRFGIGWIYITLSPFMLLTSQMFQRYMYVPAIGYSMVLGSLMVLAWDKVGQAGHGLLTLLVVTSLLVHGFYINTEGYMSYRGYEVEKVISDVKAIYPEFPRESNLAIIGSPMMEEYTAAMFRVFYTQDLKVTTYPPRCEGNHSYP